MLRVPSPFLLQFGNERFLVFYNPLLHFLPNTRTILVFDAYDLLNHFVNFTLVSFSDFYSRFFEDSLKMSEEARHINSPQQMNEMREV
jgi:predicted MPP superfamily phosphohydrolase